jgi:large subunit ribosomal protein L9
MSAKIVLKKKVVNLGEEGDVVKVKDGYARNYLLPNDLAVLATEKAVQEAEEVRKKRELELQAKIEEAKKIAEKINNLKLEIKPKQKEGKLFGSIKEEEIIKLLEDKKKVKLNKDQIIIKAPIKKVGTYSIQVNLFKEVTAKLELNVLNEKKK